MSNEQQQKQSRPQQPDRTPIAIERLIAVSERGIKVPDGIEGKGERYVHTITTGTAADVRTAIEHRPWMRAFRVTKARRVATDAGDTWVAMGKPFYVPDMLAVSVLAED